jgi:hypothetical protein
MNILLKALLLASLAAPATPQCSLCPPGSTVGNPGLEAPFLNTTTCGEYDSVLGILPDDETCTLIRDSLSTESLDFQAFCGCSGVVPPDTCLFCGSDDLVYDPEFTIPGVGITCGDLNLFVPFVVNSTICSDFSGAIPICCITDAIATCGICANGGTPGTPDKSVILEDLTCGQFDRIIALVPEDECGVTRDELGIALGAYCECEGEAIPDECALCPEGQEVEDPNRLIPEAELTCGEAEEFARFVTNVTMCEEEVALAGTVCCVAKSPTPAPTAAPADGSSYARTSWIATALVGGASIFLAF